MALDRWEGGIRFVVNSTKITVAGVLGGGALFVSFVGGFRVVEVSELLLVDRTAT